MTRARIRVEERPAGAGSRGCPRCWGEIPPHAAACPGCGASVAELDAERSARRRSDRGWAPPKPDRGSSAAVPIATDPPPAPKANPAAPASAEVYLPAKRRRRRRLRWPRWLPSACLATLALWGVRQNAAWLAEAWARLPLEAAFAQPRTRRVEARPELEGLSLQLLDPGGRVAVDSRRRRAARVFPGRYLLRWRGASGEWPGGERPISIADGGPMRLDAPPEAGAAYLLWRAKRLRQRGDGPTAEACCRKALALDPNSLGARVELANLLVDRRRLAEARGQAKEARRRWPADRPDTELRALVHRIRAVTQ